MEYFAVRITKSDLRFFGYKRGDNAGQQCWETLAILVALNQWRTHWQHVRARLAFHADNVTALTALALLKARHSSGVANVARELALEMASADLRRTSATTCRGLQTA